MARESLIKNPTITYFRAIRTIMGPVCLTAVFGMGTGVSTRVWSPGISNGSAKSCFVCRALNPEAVPGGRVNAVKRSAVSTGQLSALLHLHIPPIDLVVFQEPSQSSCWRPHLAEGFTLICLQRLSRPHVATRRCR
jgi:hypothetical protein